MPQQTRSEDGHRDNRAVVSNLQKTAQHMAKLRVSGLPRNYELFYEALFGHDADLSREVLSMTQAPAQAALDEIGLKYRLTSHCSLAAEYSSKEAGKLLHKLVQQLSQSVTQKHTFVRALETVERSMQEESPAGLSELLTEINYLNASVSELLKVETGIEQQLNEGIARLTSLNNAADNAQTTAVRDRLTTLPNHIAFTGKLDALYNDVSDPAPTALIIVDVDNFREFNLQFGQVAGNRLLRKLATSFRNSIKKNDFVARIGGDEFAFLFHDVSPAAAMSIAERLRNSIEKNRAFATKAGNETGTITLAMGVALSDGAASPRELRLQAEAALAVARTSPRTPIVPYTTEIGRTAGRHAA